MVTGKRELEDQGDGREPKRHNYGNQPLLKLLVPNYVAGALIGKGGTLITEMKEKYGGHIRLSANREVYPGTNERIVILTGENNEIIELSSCIMEKVENVTSKQPVDESRRNKVKIVLTNAAAGLLIGRGGLTIKSIQEESKAKISVSSSDAAAVSGERVLTMSGSMDERVEASKQIIEKIASDASNMANIQLKYANSLGAGVQQGAGPHFNPMEADNRNPYSALATNPSSLALANKVKLKNKVEIQLEVPDLLVGGILGKQGSIIRDIALRSGARLKFSDKNEENPTESKDRTLTITANDISKGVTAYSLICARADEVSSHMNAKSLT